MDGDPVIPLSLARIAQITGGRLEHGDPEAVVSGEVVIDSRRVAPGGLFAAVAGEHSDGHDFAAAAMAAGAVAVLATRPVPVPSVLVAHVPAALSSLAHRVDALTTTQRPYHHRPPPIHAALAAPGDVLVVAGKGHETGQYVGGAVLPFDDRRVTAEALERQAKSQDSWTVTR